MTTYLIPLFSILWGNLFLAESITLFTVLGCMLVLLGVGMTTGRLPGLSKLIPHTNAADE
jgi:drug/metabolite transporter (DMT)-like permease